VGRVAREPDTGLATTNRILLAVVEVELALDISRAQRSMSTAAILVRIQQNLVDYGASILLMRVLHLIVVDGIILGRAQLGLVL
jgi:hypothetical protein